jgi:hypothetical protein
MACEFGSCDLRDITVHVVLAAGTGMCLCHLSDERAHLRLLRVGY